MSNLQKTKGMILHRSLLKVSKFQKKANAIAAMAANAATKMPAANAPVIPANVVITVKERNIK